MNDGNMEEGSFRCDVNIFICLVGLMELGVKVEIKNINFFCYLEWVIDYEYDR